MNMKGKIRVKQEWSEKVESGKKNGKIVEEKNMGKGWG